ncbi:hypothetical protein LSH36_658g01023 [Paralvinella palmiformis]|uniref:CHAT domain-containing protein n=1 Tax=Paralvinella palmiformis TaxID=53620 RepID=A0AAD9J377_9ANNE|nr:hypothetical protein LSH36_658g01023 [Paralvinella palmiformis]
MYLSDLDGAVEQYLHMFRSTSRTDPQSQTRALCKLGKAYRTQNHYQHSIYYFEQANVIAQDFGLDSVNMICEYNLACILQHSTQMKELNQARGFLEKLVPLLEVKVKQHMEEDTFCSDDLIQELHECYCAMQMVLCKLGENNLALLYAEASKWKYMSEDMNPGFGSTAVPGFSLWDMDRVRRVVNQQNAMILFYTLFQNSYMVWVLQPGKGVVRFYQGKNQDKSSSLSQIIEQLVDSIKQKDRKVQGNELKYENRSIPYKDEDLIALRKKYEKLKTDSESHSTKGEDHVEADKRICSGASAEKTLFKILVAPVYDLLADLEQDSTLIVIPDGCMYECPFTALKDWSGKYLGDRFNISNVSNLYLLDQATQNELNWLKIVDEQEFERSQSRLGGVLRNMVTLPSRSDGDIHCGKQCQSNNIDTLSSIDSEDINLKRTSNPRLIASGAFSSREIAEPSTNRESVFTTARSKNSTSLMLSSRRDSRKQNAIPAVPQTCRRPAPASAPTSLEQMLSLHCLSTLTKVTSTNTDIVTSACQVTEFRQVSDRDRSVVIGNPTLPEKVQLHGREWQQVLDLRAAESECLEVAKMCDVTAIEGPLATKERFLKEIQTASLIHIATRICHREGYLIFAPDEGSEGEHVPAEKSYIVTSREIQNLSLSAKLVILSGGWSVTGKPSYHKGYKIESAFIAAGISVVRYRSIAYWSPWLLVGKDTDLDLVQMRHAMLDQELNRIEEEVGEQCEKAKLNPDPVTPHAFLRPDVIDESALANKEENLSVLQECMSLLLTSCANSQEIIASLIDLGKGASLNEPYIVFPHWNKDNLLMPTFEALRALNDIQLKVTDLSVKPLWTKPNIHAALSSIGFQQIGILLKFNNVPSNRRLIFASLQLMIALSIHKNPILLHKLDVNMLGLSSISDKIRMSTPWLTTAENDSEMDEKLHLARRLPDTSLHRHATFPVNEALDLVGRPTAKPQKVKVIQGSTLSSSSIPIDHQVVLSNNESDQRRDYATNILKQRLEDLDLRRRNEERRLYLPYIVNA